MAKELFQWISSVAALNDKYSDIVKVQNFGFFALSVGPLKQSSLEKFVGYAGQQKKESEGKYVLWMVSYAFPALSMLAARMDGVGSRVREEELALYVRRYFNACMGVLLSLVSHIDDPPLLRLAILFMLLSLYCISSSSPLLSFFPSFLLSFFISRELSLFLLYLHRIASPRLFRKDVVSVVKELDSKSLSDPIGKMYKRLEKHFASSTEDQVRAVL